MHRTSNIGGLSTARLKRMRDVMAGHVAHRGVPGLVTLVSRHGEVHAEAIGNMAIGGAPIERDTLFRIASMTKPIAAVAAMILVEECKLRLDDPVDAFLPELANRKVLRSIESDMDDTVPAERAITLRDILTFRLGYGMIPIFPDRHPIQKAITAAGLAPGPVFPTFPPDELMRRYGALPLVHQPGERLTYSHAIDVVGVLVSRIEGKPFYQVLDERILQPLGMIDTGFFVSVEGRRRAATMYRLDDQDRLQHDVMGQPHISPPAFCNAGGGLWSTADDYLRFIEMLMGDGTLDGVRVLSADSARLMRTDRLTDEHKQHSFLGAPFWIGRGFGLNLSVVTDPAMSAPLFGPGGVGTFSWPGAYGTWWQADPAAGLILLYLIQNMPTLSGDAAAAVAGNTSRAKLQAVQPKFVHRSYRALGL